MVEKKTPILKKIHSLLQLTDLEMIKQDFRSLSAKSPSEKSRKFQKESYTKVPEIFNEEHQNLNPNTYTNQQARQGIQKTS